MMPYGVSGMELGLAACKENARPDVLLTVPAQSTTS